jgi:hypothetical protein
VGLARYRRKIRFLNGCISANDQHFYKPFFRLFTMDPIYHRWASLTQNLTS